MSILNEPLISQVNFLVVYTTHPQNNKFDMGVKTKGMGDTKLNDSPGSASVITDGT